MAADVALVEERVVAPALRIAERVVHAHGDAEQPDRRGREDERPPGS